MSDHFVQSDHDSDGMGRRSTHSHQSVWMAHWKHSIYKPETLGHDPSSIHYQCRKNDGDIKHHGPESLPGISESSKGFREVSESRTVNIMNDSLKTTSINFRKERLESQSFPMFNLSENRGSRMSQKNVTSCAGVVSDMGTSSREFRPEGISANLEQQQLNSHESLLKKSLAISTSNQHDVEVSDPSSRWVKRLKPSASASSPYGTKSSKMEEACSHEKVNSFFSKIMRGSVTSSEPTMSKHPGKEQMALDQTTVLLRNGESSSSESERKSRDISLANPWIQRLCHQRAASPMKKYREAVVVCEPQKLNATLDEFQKKQFPSIAAMAMMGKALNSICGNTYN